jgi:dipeptidyl aminopeptidase/acylaminoacyl peptidase
MQAQWEHDQVGRPRDQITEKWLGAAPAVNRKLFFEASPTSYALVDRNTTKFLLIYGHEDDIVESKTQSERFLLSLKQAAFFARTIVVPGAGHFWAVDPLDDPASFGAYAGPRALRFLADAL